MLGVFCIVLHFLFSTIPSHDRSNPYQWPASNLSLAATSNQNVIQSASNNDLNSSQLSSSQFFNLGPGSDTSPFHTLLDQVLNETHNLSELSDLYQPAPLDYSSQFSRSDMSRLPSKKRKLNNYDWSNNSNS